MEADTAAENLRRLIADQRAVIRGLRFDLKELFARSADLREQRDELVAACQDALLDLEAASAAGAKPSHDTIRRVRTAIVRAGSSA